LEAGSGEETLDILRSNDLDLVFLDVVMPGMGGYETCRRIRAEGRGLALPVVFVTSLEDRDSRVEGKEAGGDDFLTKPVDEVDLKARARSLLRVKAYHDLKERQRELLEIELEKTRGQILRADRLATLGTLAAGVGHELSNVAGVFDASLHFIRKRAERGEVPTEEDMENISWVGRHLKTHAQQLLDMGRPGPEHESVLDLTEVVRECLSILLLSGKTKSIRVEASFPDKEIPITLNRTRVEQVFINLIGNAADALREGESMGSLITVSIQEAAEEGRVICSVTDNGPGIPPDILEKVFEPYVTTKSPGKGTGLGLPVVRNIVQAYGGELVMDSRVGEGVSFTFDFPLAGAMV